MKTEPTIVIDTREQEPWSFGAGVATVRAGLPTGDYSIVGLESRVAVERKSLEDFVGSVTFGRERFWRELLRMKALDVRAVIVEAMLLDVAGGHYRSRATPASILASSLAITVDFGIPVLWAGDRTLAARCALWMLRRAHARLTAEAA